MAENNKLDEGFEEVPLDEGFEEVPLDQEIKELKLLKQQYGKSENISKDESFLDKISRANKAIGHALTGGISTKLISAGKGAIGALQGEGNLEDLYKQYQDIEQKKVEEDIADFAINAAQGIGLDFTDEVIGAVKGGIGALTGKGNYSDLYKKARDEQRQKVAEAEARSPIASTLGNIAGSFLPAIATGGTSLIPSAARLGLKQAYKQGGKQLAKTLGSRAAVVGAEGAIISAGGSEGETFSEVANDAYEGAKTAVMLGTLLPQSSTKNIPDPEAGLLKMGGEFAETTGELGKKHTILEQAKKMYNKGKETPFFSDDVNTYKSKLISGKNIDKDRISKDINKEMEDLFSRIIGLDREHGRIIGETYEKARNVRIPVDEALAEPLNEISELFVENPRLLGRSFTDKLLKNISDLSLGKLTPVEARALKDQLFEISQTVENENVKNTAFRGYNQLKETLNKYVPGLAEANAQYAAFRAAVPETLINRGVPAKVKSPYSDDFINIANEKYGNLKFKERELYNELDVLTDALRKPGANRDAFNVYTKLKENLKNNPEMLKKMGYTDIKDFDDKVLALSDEKSMADLMGAVSPQSGIETIGGSYLRGDSGTTGLGIVLGASQLTGRTVGLAKPVINLSKKIYSVPNETLKDLSSFLMESPKTKMLGAALANALENKGTISKDAALFSIMQNPDARKVLEDFDFGFDTDADGNE